jgi:hypothetical protein
MSTLILRKFSKGRRGGPKEGVLILKKYSKRLRGMNPYRRPYLENFQRAKKIDLCQHLYFKFFLRSEKKSKESEPILRK